MIINRNVVN